MAANLTDRYGAHRRAVIEDVTWMTDCGEHPENVARRLGYKSAGSLDRLLDRWGEHSLARRMRCADGRVAA